jgi:hypothetical protein
VVFISKMAVNNEKLTSQENPFQNWWVSIPETQANAAATVGKFHKLAKHCGTKYSQYRKIKRIGDPVLQAQLTYLLGKIPWDFKVASRGYLGSDKNSTIENTLQIRGKDSGRASITITGAPDFTLGFMVNFSSNQHDVFLFQANEILITFISSLSDFLELNMPENTTTKSA